MPPEESITMFLQCWPKGNTVGDALRIVQRLPEYVAFEKSNQYDQCWQMLVKEFHTHGKTKA